MIDLIAVFNWFAFLASSNINFPLLPLFTGYFVVDTLHCISIFSFSIVKRRNLWIIEPADGTSFCVSSSLVLFIVGFLFYFLQLSR